MNNTFINIIYLGGIILSYNIGLYTNRLYHKYNNFINTKNNVLRLQELENDNELKKNDKNFEKELNDMRLILNNLKARLNNINKLTKDKWIL